MDLNLQDRVAEIILINGINTPGFYAEMKQYFGDDQEQYQKAFGIAQRFHLRKAWNRLKTDTITSAAKAVTVGSALTFWLYEMLAVKYAVATLNPEVNENALFASLGAAAFTFVAWSVDRSIKGLYDDERQYCLDCQHDAKFDRENGIYHDKGTLTRWFSTRFSDVSEYLQTE